MPHDRRYDPPPTRYRVRRDRQWWPERAPPSDYDSYREFDSMRWPNETEGEQYFGTGSHYGGGFGTAPSSRASGAGTPGAPGYAGQGVWTDPADWTPEAESEAMRGPWSETVSHRGRGPRGYLRSDERLLETICERLTEDPRIDASEIEVEVRDQVVTLRGSVDQRRTKYAVEELVEGSGAREIDNQLRVTASRW